MVIYSMRLAGKLMSDGFVLQGMERNYNQSGKHIFHFKDSEQLQLKIQEYKISKQEQKTAD